MELKTGRRIDSSPAVAGGVVYVASDDHKIYALNAANGALIWNYTTGGGVLLSSPAVANNVVFIGADHKIYALNAANGALIWNFTTRGEVNSSPAVANGLVFVGSADHNVYALNASTGTLVWKYTTGGYVDSGPAVFDEMVFADSADHNVYALNASTGTLLWNYTTGNIVASSPAVADGIVFIGSTDNKVYALNATNGALIWSYITGGILVCSPAVADGVVYLGSWDHKVYAFGSSSNVHSISVLDWIVPILAVVAIAICHCAILIAFFVRRRKGKGQLVDSAVQENPPKPKGTLVTKVEVIDNTVKFFVAKGFRKKQWVAVKEIPVYEITGIGNFGNELSVTWKGVTNTFFVKENAESFGKLRDEVNGMLEEQRKSIENNEKAALRRKELLGVINASIGIIDLSFDVLIGLQEKRINWQRLDGYSNGFGGNFSFTGQTIASLSLDFSKVSSAIKRQIPKETSKEAYNILKAIYGYFRGLSLRDDFKESVPNFQNANSVILAYLALNDLLLGKVVGDKENKKENSQLETVLQNLDNETNFKVNIDELKGSIDKMGLETDKESVIEVSRGIFKKQLKQL